MYKLLCYADCIGSVIFYKLASEYRMHTQQSREHYFKLTASPQMLGLLPQDHATFIDEVTLNLSSESKQSTLDNQKQKDGFGEMLYESLNEIFIFDAESFKFIDVNKGALKNIGYSLADLKNLTPLDIKPEFDAESFNKLVAPLKNHTQERVIFSTAHKRKDGSTYPAEIHLQLLSYNGKSAFIALSLDITRHQQHQEKLEMLAYYDSLTELPNRALFSDRLQQAIAQSKRNNLLLAICFLDLDNFKPINDNFGHSVGDQLLVEVSQRIQSEIREGDTVSRLGGDEFTLLLGNINSFPECERMLERIHYSLSQPYLIDGNQYQITASSGVTVYPLDDSDAYKLVCHADKAMYNAKLAGKNQFHFFSVLDAGH